MRTTVELPDQVLRQAKAEAALAGVKLKDFIADALRAKLAELHGAGNDRATTPSVEMRQMGRFRIPVTRSNYSPGSVRVTPDQLAEIDLEEDVERNRDLSKS